MCRYQFGNKKLHAFVEAGFSPSIFLTMRNVTVKNGKKTVDYRQDFSTSSIDKFQLLGNISFGINYSINERYQVFGQPIFRYSLTPVADTPLTRYLFSGGVEMGVRRRI